MYHYIRTSKNDLPPYIGKMAPLPRWNHHQLPRAMSDNVYYVNQSINSLKAQGIIKYRRVVLIQTKQNIGRYTTGLYHTQICKIISFSLYFPLQCCYIVVQCRNISCTLIVLKALLVIELTKCKYLCAKWRFFNIKITNRIKNTAL